MEIHQRLKWICSFVNEEKVADIGCDHGYVPIYLIKENIAKDVIAMDINKGPLKKANENIKKYKLENNIETRLSNGLKELKKAEVDTIIIAGMGGKLIENLLESAKCKIRSYKKLILSPHSEPELVRKKLSELGFEIFEEDMMIEQGHYYTIIVAKPVAKLSEEKFEFSEAIIYKYGNILISNKNKVLVEKILKDIKSYEELLIKLEEKNVHKRVSEIKKALNELKEVYEFIK